MNNVAEESFANVRTVKAFANEKNEIAKFDEGNVKVLNIGIKISNWQAIIACFVQLFFFSAVTLVIWYAA